MFVYMIIKGKTLYLEHAYNINFLNIKYQLAFFLEKNTPD